ncbi:GNAT family N-acetyltransferase [Mangrovibacter sp. SLW1]
MKITSSRLLLRPVTPGDADDLFRIYGDPLTQQFNPAGPYPSLNYAREMLRSWLEDSNQPGFGHWAIIPQGNPQVVIGFGGLTPRVVCGYHINNLGYRFAPSWWGKGLATEFAQAVVAWGFEQGEMDTISAVIRPGHSASQHVLEKTGFHFEREVADPEHQSARLFFTLSRGRWRASQEADAK